LPISSQQLDYIAAAAHPEDHKHGRGSSGGWQFSVGVITDINAIRPVF
jgi:hypothetical protein